MEKEHKTSLKDSTSVFSLSAVKERCRQEIHSIRKENRQNSHLSRRFCRTPSIKVLSKQSAQIDNSQYNAENVKHIAKQIQKKSDYIEDQLKYLRVAFAYTSDYVKAFLEVNNSLYSLIGYLTGKNSSLQLESLWCITNLSANYHQDHILQVVKATAPYLITYLQSGSAILQDQSAISLGNMASDSEEVRELLIHQGILHPLIELTKNSNSDIVQSALFALCNMSKSRQTVVPAIMSSELPFYFTKLLHNKKTDICLISELAWLLTYLTCEERDIDFFVCQGIVNDILYWVTVVRPHQKEFHFAVTPLVRCLGNIAGSDNEKIEIKKWLQTNNFILSLNSFLNTNKRYLIKECLWLIANIFSRHQELFLTDDINGIEMLVTDVKRHLSSAYEIRKESLICIYNMTEIQELRGTIYDEDVVKELLNILKLPNAEIVYLTLQCIENGLRHNFDEFSNVFIANSGPSYLEALSYNESDDVRRKAINLLDDYFENEPDYCIS